MGLYQDSCTLPFRLPPAPPTSRPRAGQGASIKLGQESTYDSWTAFPAMAKKPEQDDFDAVVEDFVNKFSKSLETSDKGGHYPDIPRALGAFLDDCFSDLDYIERLIERGSGIREKLPGWPGRAAIDDASLEKTIGKVREQGFEATIVAPGDRRQVELLFKRTLVDDRLQRRFHEAICERETFSDFWTARVFAPRLLLVEVGAQDGYEQDQCDPLEASFRCELNIEGRQLKAALSGLHGYAGWQVQCVLRPARDPAIEQITQRGSRPPSRAIRVGLREWCAVYSDCHQGLQRCRISDVSSNGETECVIDNRPPDFELMDSVLAIAFFIEPRDND